MYMKFIKKIPFSNCYCIVKNYFLCDGEGEVNKQGGVSFAFGENFQIRIAHQTGRTRSNREMRPRGE